MRPVNGRATSSSKIKKPRRHDTVLAHPAGETGQSIKAGDRLHWTGIDQNWNYQCAECLSTNLRKAFDVRTNTFKTTWSEIDVACESCHGPGSKHGTWAKKEGDWRNVSDKGMAIVLDERQGVSWTRKADDATAGRSMPRMTNREVET